MNYILKKLKQRKEMYLEKIKEIDYKIKKFLQDKENKRLKINEINLKGFIKIKDYPNYLINNQGKIYSLKNNKFIKSYKCNTGYYMVCLFEDGKNKTYLVHRLVASTFIPNPNNYEEVNHKDFNKSNNNADNLEWCSREYNLKYSNLSGFIKKPIYQILDNVIIKEYSSITEAEKCGFDSSHISKCCKNKEKTHKGYVWKYKY